MLEQIQSRFNKLFVWFIVIVELVSISALISVAFSREHFQAISKSIYPDSDILFNSVFLNLMVSDILGYVLFIVLFIVVIKEFLIKQLKLRIYYNMGLLIFLLAINGLVFRVLYFPVSG